MTLTRARPSNDWNWPCRLWLLGRKSGEEFVGAGARIVAISDRRDDRLVLAGALYPDADLVREWREVMRHPNVDAVIVATPPTTHFQIAFDSLAAGKNVLVEKPMTTSSRSGAPTGGRSCSGRPELMVDHTFFYASSIRTIRRMIGEGDLGELQYYNSVRIGPRPQSRSTSMSFGIWRPTTLRFWIILSSISGAHDRRRHWPSGRLACR